MPSAPAPTLPRALLLDFGGVLVDGPGAAVDWAGECAATVHTLISARGASGLDPRRIAADLGAGIAALAAWSAAMCRPFAPVEVSHAQFWSDYVAADWPAAAREAVLRHAEALTLRLGEVSQRWLVRPGIPELLAAASRAGLRLAVVSNTLYGRVHRDFLERVGLADHFAVQLYSDEVGVRKPNPEIALRAARAVGVPPARCWFVGDTWSRDVRCARRAGMGAAVLLRSSRTAGDPCPPELTADHVLDEPTELAMLLGLDRPGAAGSAGAARDDLPS